MGIEAGELEACWAKRGDVAVPMRAVAIKAGRRNFFNLCTQNFIVFSLFIWDSGLAGRHAENSEDRDRCNYFLDKNLFKFKHIIHALQVFL